MREALGQQRVEVRRGAPGKRFVGDAAEQSRNDRRAQLARVERMAELDAAERRAKALGVPLRALVVDLVRDSVALARTLVAAPFRIALAVWRPRELREA